MPAYPTRPDVAKDIRDLKRRMTAVETKVANLGPQPTGSTGSTYDANKLWNGRFESGATTTWQTGFWTGTPGKLTTESADPLDELQSGRVDEVAGSATQIWWRPTRGAAAGQDVFPCTPGEQWHVSVKVRTTQPITNGRLVACCGTTEADCYGIFGAQTYVLAANLPLTAGTITLLDGVITVPASRNFITFIARIGVDDAPPPAVPWTWWLDDAVLQKKLS